MLVLNVGVEMKFTKIKPGTETDLYNSPRDSERSVVPPVMHTYQSVANHVVMKALPRVSGP